jgi:hypothetical protein
MSKQYNHAFDTAFALINESETDEATAEELLIAMEARMNLLGTPTLVRKIFQHG